MKILEGLIKVREGSVIVNPHGTRLKKDFNNPQFLKDILVYDATERWLTLDIYGFDIFRDADEWEIYEEPKHKIAFQLVFNVMNSFSLERGTFQLISNIPARNKEECLDWLKALETFFELKCHPLTVEIRDGKIQCCIGPDSIEPWGLEAQCWNTSSFKIPLVSPIFASIDDTMQAIQDIGESRLIHMFKTFHGIYE